MTTLTHFPAYGMMAPSALDRLRSGTGGGSAMAIAPSRATTRPGLIETVFATRGERAILREREAAAVAVETEQVAAAMEVAIAHTRDTKELALKARQAETARGHAEMEYQMQMDTHDADTNDSRVVNRLVTDVAVAEKQVLDEVEALAHAGRIAPDRAELLAEIVRSNTERVVTGALDLRDMIRDSRTDRLTRALSRTPERR